MFEEYESGYIKGTEKKAEKWESLFRQYFNKNANNCMCEKSPMWLERIIPKLIVFSLI